MNKMEQKFYDMKMAYLHDAPEELKKEKRDEIHNKYLAVKLSERNRIKEIIYPVLRDYMNENLFNSNYEGVIKAFNEIKSTDRYQSESIVNKTIMNNMLLKSYLYICLESDGIDSPFFNESESLLESLETFLQQRDKYSFEQYESEFKKFNESKAMCDALSSGDFWTEIKLILPFPMGISEQSLDLIVSDYEVKLRTEQFPSGLGLMEADNGVVQLSFDKYGLLTRTTVTLKIKKYLSLKNEKLYFFGDKETRSIALIFSINLLNEIISRYRLFNNNYWIDNIDPRMIEISSIKFIASGVVVKDIVAQSENTYTLKQKYDYNTPEENKQLAKLFEKNKNDFLWQELLADAKSFLLISKLRESIISLNSSFENFFYIKFKKIISNYEGQEKTDLFFEGDISYKDFGSRELLDEETFNKLKKAGVFPKGVPSVYKVIKKYYTVVPKEQQITYSKSQLLKIIDKIRKHRNDIVHGNLHIDLSEKHVYESINEFINMSTSIEDQHKF